jgi:hypothetical protein
VPEGAFTREFTQAKNARQVISVNVGHGLLIDFQSYEATPIGGAQCGSCAAGKTTFEQVDFGRQVTWWNGPKTVATTYDAVKLYVAHGTYVGNTGVLATPTGQNGT